MSRIRWFLVWLAMVAVPLQGLAAASMLFCGSGPHSAPAQAAGAPHHTGHGDHGAVAADGESAHHSSTALPDATHKCGLCAACCHSMGVAPALEPLSLASLPRPGFHEPFAPVHSRSLQVPDKPPRA